MIEFAVCVPNNAGIMIAVTLRKTEPTKETYPLPAVRLYREDLAAIARAVAEGGDLLIATDGYEATSADQLADERFPDSPVSLTISADRPPRKITARLSAGSATIELIEPDTLSAGIVSHIRLICESRRLRLRSLVCVRMKGFVPVVPLVLAFSLAFMIGGIIAATQLKPPVVWVAQPVSIALFGLVALASGGFLWVASWPVACIVNAPRAERPGYWQRTRDMWITGTVTALGGAVVGFLLGRIT